MNIPLTKIFLVLMFVFALFSNILNYVAIATTEWLTRSYTTPVSSLTIGIWKYDITPYALIATGTALNILSLLFAVVSLSSLCVAKIRDQFAVFFVFACLLTSLLALLFNSTGWYFITVTLQKEFAAIVAPNSMKFSVGWSYWLMTPSFGCNVLAAVFAACIIGCSFALNKFENRQRRTQLQSPAHVYQISTTTAPTTTKNPSFSNEGFYTNEPRPSSGAIQTTTYSYQNETYQNEQRVLRL